MSTMLSSDASFRMEMFPFGHCPEGNGDVSSIKFVGETLRKSDQFAQTFEKAPYNEPLSLDNMIELPKLQPKRTYNEDLECEIVMVKIPKCMAWLDDELIGDLDTIEDKVDNPSPQCTPQVLPSIELYTPPVTHPKEVENTIGISMEVEPLTQETNDLRLKY
ncbi:hypothetical protein Tco_1212434 [Tanacetum coccineum]